MTVCAMWATRSSRGAAAVVVARGGGAWRRQRAADRGRRPRGLALAQLAAIFHGRQPATMVAVTGTSGKTSVASFTAPNLGARRARGRQHRHHRGSTRPDVSNTGR